MIQSSTQIRICVFGAFQLTPYEVFFPIPTFSITTVISYSKNTNSIVLWRSTLTSTEVIEGELVGKDQIMTEKD
jgi:hypothetical protein